MSMATAGSTAHCAACTHFIGEARTIERLFAGLTALSSAQGSTTADDGFCRHHDRFQRARGSCEAFTDKTTTANVG